MKRLSFSLLLTTTFLLAACANVGDAPEAETTTVEPITIVDEPAFSGMPLALNPDNTDIEWTAAKVTRTHEGGFSAFSGAIYVDGESVTGLALSIDAASIISDTDRLTNHLKSDDFFDVAVFPEARFEATAFEAIAEGTDETGATHTVTGTLTMRDHTNQIVFPASVVVNADSVSASADFLINRQLWGLAYPGQPDDLIQDEVRLRLSMNAARNEETGTEEVDFTD